MNFYDGFDDLMNDFKELISKVDDVTEVLEEGAKEFVSDLLKLPKPMSKIRISGYTHLVDSFTYKTNNNEIEVGWGKYYGRMVEKGTVLTRSNPHLEPTFERNKEKYYKNMINKIF